MTQLPTHLVETQNVKYKKYKQTEISLIPQSSPRGVAFLFHFANTVGTSHFSWHYLAITEISKNPVSTLVVVIIIIIIA